MNTLNWIGHLLCALLNSCLPQNKTDQLIHQMQKSIGRGEQVQFTDKVFTETVDFTRLGEKSLIGPDQYEVHIASSIVFQNCQFNKPVIAGRKPKNGVSIRTVFGLSVSFIDCTFTDEVQMRGVRIAASGNFSGSVFQRDVDFRQSVFEHDTSFKGTRFEGRTQFQYSLFRGDVSFLKAVFLNIFNGQGTRFIGRSKFNLTEFTGPSDFSFIQCRDKLEFSYANFLKMVNFGNAEFDRQVRFKKAVFYEGVDFQESRFGHAVDFQGAMGHAAINLANCIFNAAEPDFTKSSITEVLK